MAQTLFKNAMIPLMFAVLLASSFTNAIPSFEAIDEPLNLFAPRFAEAKCKCYTASTTVRNPKCVHSTPSSSSTCTTEDCIYLHSTVVPPSNTNCPTTPTTTFYSSLCGPTCTTGCQTTTSTYMGCNATVTTVTPSGCVHLPCASPSPPCTTKTTVTVTKPACGCTGTAVPTVTSTGTCPTTCDLCKTVTKTKTIKG